MPRGVVEKRASKRKPAGDGSSGSIVPKRARENESNDGSDADDEDPTIVQGGDTQGSQRPNDVDESDGEETATPATAVVYGAEVRQARVLIVLTCLLYRTSAPNDLSSG
jgi:hypothetical protein